MPDLTAHEVLVKARNLIEREGWMQKDLGGRGRGYCALGAVDADGRRDTAAAQTAWETLSDTVGAVSVVPWNNAPGRTKEEVLAAFDEAIRRTSPPPADPLANVEPQRIGAAA